jgi:hypothetical protein
MAGVSDRTSGGPVVPDMIAPSGGGQSDPSGGGYGGDGAGAAGDMRPVMDAIKTYGAKHPECGAEITQIQALLRRCLVRSAQGAPGQNASAQQVPTGT